jgi:hypothetical protein
VQGSAFPYNRSTSEPTPELAPNITQGQSAQPGQYERMMSGWPAVARHVTDLRITLGAAKYWWEPVPGEMLDEARFREDLEALTETMYVDAENDLQGFGLVAEQWADFWLQGTYWSELRLVDCDGPARNFHILTGKAIEAYPIHASNISVFEQEDNYRRLVGIRQQSSTGSALIPIDRLIWAQRGGRVGDYSGVSVLRPLLFPFQRWLSLWLSREQAAAMQGGCIVATPSLNAAGDAEWDAMRTTLNRWQNGQARYVMTRPGWTIAFEAPSGAVGGDEIETLDGYVDRVLGGQVQALIDSASGHRALGEVVATQEQAQRTDELGLFLGRLGTRLARWVAERSAYGGRLPTLGIKPTDVTQTPIERIATAQAAITAFGLTPTPADQQWGREVAGLPADEPGAVEVIPADGAAPVEMAEDLIPPNGAADSAAAAVLAFFDTPSAERGLSGRELDLAKRIAARGAISATEARMLSVWFRAAGDVTTDPTWQTKGRAYQAWHGRGGQAMAEWLRAMHDDVDGVAPVVVA